MTNYGYALSSEEHPPKKLIETAAQCEAAGFEFALISDHYHPWVPVQGNSAFVWAVLGGIAQNTSTLRVGTGVTCPILRIHPAIIAQAAATVATLFDGRFFLGLGAGENLNEHVLGHRWPRADERHERLREAIEIIRALWKGDVYSHSGAHYTVDEARLYTLPEQLPDIYVAASGPDSAELAAHCGDGLIGVAPDKALLNSFEEHNGNAEKTYGQVTVCYAESVSKAQQIAARYWPTAGLEGNLSWETKSPELFASAVKPLTETQIVKNIACGPDIETHLQAISKFADAGYSHVYIHQVGPDQDGFLKFYERELKAELQK